MNVTNVKNVGVGVNIFELIYRYIYILLGCGGEEIHYNAEMVSFGDNNHVVVEFCTADSSSPLPWAQR